ncbi:MAG: hypothetical protein CVU97_03550 [Firmicutes bacterium HGW-Firmicutes-21]|nr:MAG: hypothetical protein CVU97_03550 [Firmicutes bacterium HGW-Firmicutes-21]
MPNKRRVLSLLIILSLIVLSLSACEFVTNPYNRLNKLKNEWQDKIIAHFEENEEIFNELINVILEDYPNTKIYLYNKGDQHTDEYVIEINGDKRALDEENDFSLSETLTIERLNKIFCSKEDWKSDGTLKKNILKCFSLSIRPQDNDGEDVWCSFSLINDGNIDLVYSNSGKKNVDDFRSVGYFINDNWYIRYFDRMLDSFDNSEMYDRLFN